METATAGAEPLAPPPLLRLRGVAKRFQDPSGQARTVIDEFELTVRPGEFCALIGPTGCGKSTVLSLIAGLAKASGGASSPASYLARTK